MIKNKRNQEGYRNLLKFHGNVFVKLWVSVPSPYA